jgi:hypothetical protein
VIPCIGLQHGGVGKTFISIIPSATTNADIKYPNICTLVQIEIGELHAVEKNIKNEYSACVSCI